MEVVQSLPEEELSDADFDEVDLIDAFAGADRFHDDHGLADAAVNFLNPPRKRLRARLPQPWRSVAIFTGVSCAEQARNALRDVAGPECFETKGKVWKARDTVFRPGIPLAQTPRVNRDGTAVSEAKCPFSSVLALCFAPVIGLQVALIVKPILQYCASPCRAMVARSGLRW